MWEGKCDKATGDQWGERVEWKSVRARESEKDWMGLSDRQMRWDAELEPQAEWELLGKAGGAEGPYLSPNQVLTEC